MKDPLTAWRMSLVLWCWSLDEGGITLTSAPVSTESGYRRQSSKYIYHSSFILFSDGFLFLLVLPVDEMNCDFSSYVVVSHGTHTTDLNSLRMIFIK